MTAYNWADGLTRAEIITLANILITGTNRALDMARATGEHSYRDMARDNRTAVMNLEFAYASK